MSSKSKTKQITYVFIGIAYSFFLYLIYRNSGIITGNEAEKYILASQKLINGDIAYSIRHHFFYCSYIVFITPFMAVGGAVAVVIAQALLNIIAAICINKSVDLIFPNNKKSFIGGLIFLFSYPIQYWTLTLFSDNFFVSLISITLYYTLKRNKTKPQLLFWLFLLTILLFTRPPGIFLAIGFLSYFLYESKLMTGSKAFLTAFVLQSIVLACLFYIPVENKGYIKPIAASTIIVDKPEYAVPGFTSNEKSTLNEAYVFLMNQHGFSHVISLYAKKFVSFFTLTRPYYSTINNGLLSLYYSFYLLALAGLFLIRKQKAIVLLFLSSVFLLANLTALTYNEWHYRFTLATFPFIFILSVIALNPLLTAMWRKLKPD
jgi:hypothetical protein